MDLNIIVEFQKRTLWPKKKKEIQKREKNELNVVIVINFSKEKILEKSMVIAR